ncbi:Ribosomal RNA-processing protein 7 [Colletotrichum gloeosporioides]|uniref:Ribosomal RNA-processing protein 7 n=1 Tax=Colletotrichum gloeosporioides TaxID=474922 RepID=A0A8H4CS92_COLGL|nr:Ribosomal RNA-processing protein 7 [Colletotrichum gloeosporioides]KAF3809158.1 Ribosomal RNA-processing protein 7 [Colletotrichum gloeosporioides]
MGASEQIDLRAPFVSDTLLEVRTSTMKKMPGLEIESGIDKNLRNGPIRVSFLGLEDDEHDPTFHGGVDKAIHGSADRFQPGGFGENFVTKHMNERNVCIGDVIAVGDEVVLQVSLPRQPCFKLNHRFQLKNFAPNTYRTSRTGWYYRVLKEGTVKAGDEIKLIERKWPAWTIERVQEFLHRDQSNLQMNEELAQIEEMGKESRGAFQRRVAKAKAQAKKTKEKGEEWRDYKIVEKKRETSRVSSFNLESVSGDAQPEVDMEGAHTKIKLPNGLLRSYSIVSGEPKRFELGIALEANGRGGSRWFHESANVGDIVKVGRITTDVKVASASSNHVFIVGGIGITAFMALMEAYHKVHYNFELHYGIRSADDVPFLSRLESFGKSARIYDGSKGERMDIGEIMGTLKWNSHVYVCGPTRMMEAAKKAAEESGLDATDVHYEAFAADTTGDPFEVEVSNRDGKVLKVSEEETLLEVIKRDIGDLESSCEVGNCGTCKVVLKSGRVDHRGTALSPEEKAGSMLSCWIEIFRSCYACILRREHDKISLTLLGPPAIAKMPSTESQGDGFVLLPVKIPALPSCPVNAVHEIRVRRNAPKIPTEIDDRSLFLKNVPVDSTEAHFRQVFAALVGPGRFEGIAFEDERKAATAIDPAQAVKVSNFGKKRKRGEQEAEERAKEEEVARLPDIWTRRLRKSGSSAIVLLADDKSVELVLKAIKKANKSKKYPVWGEGVSEDLPELGSQWISTHLQLSRCDKVATQKSVHAFFNVFNRKEKEAQEMAKRLRNEPDEDGFVTVTRGGRAAPASKNEAEEARQKMVDKAAKKKSETTDFYRFQMRERRKAEQAALMQRFDEDRKKVDAMREKRGKFRPET